MIVSLLSSLAAITLTNGQLNALSTPAPLLSSSPSISPSPSCRPSCPSDAQFVNDMCYWETEPIIYNNICNDGDVYDSNMQLCVNMYLSTPGADCRPGYMFMNYMNYNGCVMMYPGRPSVGCPENYISIKDSAESSTIKCIRYKNATCDDDGYIPEPSQMHPYDPLPTELSPSPSCLLICPTSNQTFSEAIKGTFSQYMQSQYVNGSCYYNMPLGEYMGCPSEKQTYIASSNTCIDYYVTPSDNECQEGYVIRQMNGGVYCVREVPAMYEMCPPDYKSIMYNDRYICVKKVDPICASPMPSAVVSAESSSTPKVVESPSASNTPKVVERTMSPSSSPRPSNVDVLDVTNGPVVIVATKKPECNIWVCPKDYSVENVNGKTVCKYYKTADYNQIKLPDSPEGNTGGFYNDYFCPAGTKLVVIKGAVESKKYWCEGYADAKWLACPTQSPRIRTPIAFPSPIYKTIVPRTRGPSRRPLFWQSSLEFNGAIADALADPKVIKKLIIGLSCAVNDMPSSIKIKSICKKGNTTVCIPFTIPQVEDVLIDCKRMYPSPSTSPTTYLKLVLHRRELQEDSSTVQVNYEYQPAENMVVPTTINVNDSPVLTEVALDISLTDEPSGMVAYGMTSDPATGSNQNTASTATTPDDGAVSRNAIVGIVVGCAALGAVIALAIVGNKAYKRQRKEKMMTSKIEKNPIVDIVPVTDRWAGPPTMV